ncbi:MAG TPA: prefoldin subunit beta [Candidatus Thermoplasmatota archaeon]|nr:prefoldin subunit beta [Candidatus Thermoplasmatota archaeon]
MADPAHPPALPQQVQQQLQQLQALNQQLQATAQQRAQYEAMKAESEQALDALQALPDDAPVFRSVGALLVQDSKKAAHDRLKDDAETMEVRVARMQKQETALREQLQALQAKVQAALQGKS